MSIDVKKIWDACGAAFDRFTSAEDSYAENIEQPVIERMAGSVVGQRVLDLGCGSGVYSVLFAARGAEVTALDLSPSMIALAGDKARERGLKIDFRVADVCEPLPFGDCDFDLVFTATALHYVEDLKRVFSETARVMKRDGRLIASVLHPVSTALFPLAEQGPVKPRDQWQPSYFGNRLRQIETPWIEFGDVSNEGRIITSYHHTISDYFNALVSAGLTVVELSEPEPPSDFA
jgi:ubiquinone/menaquinone biosynthesis C-methylase UbiE